MNVVPVTHMDYGAERALPDAEEALRRADWLLRYGLDRLGNDGHGHHAGVRTHGEAARTQLVAVVRLLDQAG